MLHGFIAFVGLAKGGFRFKTSVGHFNQTHACCIARISEAQKLLLSVVRATSYSISSADLLLFICPLHVLHAAADAEGGVDWKPTFESVRGTVSIVCDNDGPALSAALGNTSAGIQPITNSPCNVLLTGVPIDSVSAVNVCTRRHFCTGPFGCPPVL